MFNISSCSPYTHQWTISILIISVTNSNHLVVPFSTLHNDYGWHGCVQLAIMRCEVTADLVTCKHCNTSSQPKLHVGSVYTFTQ